MLESFGARLRQRREEQDIALVAIAQETKIKLSLLEALERDDVSHWPSGIFRRAFLRAYAHAIGLDPNVAVREFLEAHPEPAETVEAAPGTALGANGAPANGRPPTRFHYGMGSAIGSLLRLGRGAAADDRVTVSDVPLKVPASSMPALPVAVHSAPEPGHIDQTNRPAANGSPVNGSTPAEPDLLAVAQLCTEFGQVESTNDVQPLLREAARILDATGLIVWVWDEVMEELRPALVYGYSEKVLAQLPAVKRDTDNVTAAAFRAAHTYEISGQEHACGALVVPLLTRGGCAGVLAIELQHGGEQARSVRAIVTILAALLAPLIGGIRVA